MKAPTFADFGLVSFIEYSFASTFWRNSRSQEKHILHYNMKSITLHFVALAFSFSLVAAIIPLNNAKDELQIRNKISLHAFSQDTQNFNLLDQIFTPDVVLDYRVAQLGDPQGLPALKAFYVKALTGFVTQHTLDTVLVEKTGPKRDEVNSTTYLVANYLGQGNLTGQAAFVYGRYLDSWCKQKGDWKSKRSTLQIFVSLEAGLDGLKLLIGS